MLKYLAIRLTCESSCEKMASKANILGAATPTLRSSGAAEPLHTDGSINVTCFFRLSRLKKLFELSDSTPGDPLDDVVEFDTLSITLTCKKEIRFYLICDERKSKCSVTVVGMLVRIIAGV